MKALTPVLVLTTMLLVVYAARRVRAEHTRRQIVGRLSFDPKQVPARTYALNRFILTWDPAAGGRVTVHHQAQPDQALWASLPGLGFVAAARGVETVTTHSRHFYVQDQLKVVCPHQTIDAITSTPKQVTIRGSLRAGGKGETVAYTCSFTALAPNQLGFRLTLTDPTYNRTFLTYASSADERFFGFGAQFSHFDLKGKRLPIIVNEQGVGRGAQPITFAANLAARAGGAWHTTYAAVPHYISSRCRSLALESYEYAIFDMRKDDRVQVQLYSSHMTGRIFYGASPAELIQAYTAYAGRMRPLPDWILEGAVVGMQGGTDQVREIYARLKARGAPVAAFWLEDWVGQRVTKFGKQLWWTWELDDGHYPGWENLLTEFAADGVKLMTYINPHFVDADEKGACRRNLFKEAQAKGFLVRNLAGGTYMIRITYFSAGMLDLTNPDARAWMKAVIKEQVIAAGAWGWMADYGEALPYDALLHAGEPASQHNRYPQTWAELNREAIQETGRGDQLVFFCRSAYRHSPRYATLFWLGDQTVTWDEHDGIKTAVTGLLSSGMSGFAFNHSDIGGHTGINHSLLKVRRSKELLWRWIELNAFTSIYRTHGGNLPDENYQFYSDEETLAHFCRFASVYKAWAFYRKQLVREAAETGLPVVRHPFIHYPSDPNVHPISYQQFMVGSEWMVAPVLDPGLDQVNVYLPAGRWVHLWTDKRYGSLDQGVTVTVSAPLGQPGAFYREGSAAGEQFVANLNNLGLINRAPVIRRNAIWQRKNQGLFTLARSCWKSF